MTKLFACIVALLAVLLWRRGIPRGPSPVRFKDAYEMKVSTTTGTVAPPLMPDEPFEFLRRQYLQAYHDELSRSILEGPPMTVFQSTPGDGEAMRDFLDRANGHTGESIMVPQIEWQRFAVYQPHGIEFHFRD